jgi:hypothetical protein
MVHAHTLTLHTLGHEHILLRVHVSMGPTIGHVRPNGALVKSQ